MRSFFLIVGFSLIAVTASAQQVVAPAAPDMPARAGFWFSLGAGVGSRGLSCDNCIGAERELGFSTTFRVGATVSPQVTLGINLVGWIKPLDDPGRGEYGFFTALMGMAQVYPFRQRGFFVQGGGGYIIDVVDDDLVLDSPGIILGLGYDLRMRKGFSLTPQINYLRTLDGGNLVSNLYQLGIAATWH